jgi:predicted permease
MGSLFRDISYGLRASLRNPGFTLAVVLTLALGMGPNTVIFTVLDAVLLNEGPYSEASKLMILNETDQSHATQPASYPDFVDWTKMSHSFERMAAYRNDSFNLRYADSSERVDCQSISVDFFRTLGATPAMGRDFIASDFDHPEERAVILSHAYWQKRFGGRADIVGAKAVLDGAPGRVIGVMEKNFRSFFAGRRARMWTPLTGRPEQQDRAVAFVEVVARPKPEVSRAQAEAEMKLIASGLASAYPASNAGRGIRLRSIREIWMSSVGPGPRIVAFLAVCVLLVACANVANILLARGVFRNREFALRRALGAGRFRIIRQLLTESVVLGLLGAAAGVLLAYWGLALMNHYSGEMFNDLGIESFELDVRAVKFAILLGLFAGVVFGSLPALRTSGSSLAEALKEGGAVISARRGKSRVAGLLVVSELVVATMLLTAVSLYVYSYTRSLDVILAPGFRVSGILTADLAVAENQDRRREPSQFFAQAVERVAALPGVSSVGIVSTLPGAYSPARARLTMGVADPSTPIDKLPGAWVNYRIVGADYFRAFDIPLIRGRFLNEHDTATSTRVAVVNRKAALDNWPNGNPIGATISVNRIPHTVVGVVGDVRTAIRSTDREPQEVCVSYLQDCPDVMRVVIRSGRSAQSLLPELRREVRAIGPDEGLSELRTMQQYLHDAMGGSRFLVGLFVAFALLAISISAAGVYGVMSHFVSQKTPEIGVRMALGASAHEVVRHVVGQGAALLGIGIGIGLALSIALAQILPTIMFGVVRLHPVVYLSIGSVLAGIALLACYLPARRASRVDPLRALRSE